MSAPAAAITTTVPTWRLVAVGLAMGIGLKTLSLTTPPSTAARYLGQMLLAAVVPGPHGALLPAAVVAASRRSRLGLATLLGAAGAVITGLVSWGWDRLLGAI